MATTGTTDMIRLVWWVAPSQLLVASDTTQRAIALAPNWNAF